MLRILGPTYTYQGETLHDKIVYIDDHCYHSESGTFPVQKLLQANPGDRLLVFDHLGHDDVLNTYPHVCLPVYLADELEQFIKQQIQPNWTNKRHCFNFMINKPRPNRQRLMELVVVHGLTDFCHTLPWSQSPFPDHIPITDYKFGDEVCLDQGIKNGRYLNAMTYQSLLQKSVFEPTCVSLITEPCFYEKEIMITEKTLMSIFAGTIPLWIGGWRLPDAMRDLGFDVFDDIVDHSYSQLPNAWQRLQQAFDLNLDLLRDTSHLLRLMPVLQSRLQANLDLLLTNPFLGLVRQRVGVNPQLRAVANCWAHLKNLV